MSDTLKQMVAEAEIGEQARMFVESELGKVLIGMARQEVEVAMLDFDEADTSDKAKIDEIKLRMRFGRRFEAWLCELITKGNEALEAYSQYGEKN